MASFPTTTVSRLSSASRRRSSEPAAIELEDASSFRPRGAKSWSLLESGVPIARSRTPSSASIQRMDSTGSRVDRIKRGSCRGSAIPALTPLEVAQRHQTSIELGLTSSQARKILEDVGPNELATTEPPPFWIIWLKTLKDIILMIILAGAWINILALDGGKVTGIIMLMMWVGASLINAIGEWSSVDGGDALKGMACPMASVRRDGSQLEVPSRELVPGDVVLIKSGCTIPADMRIVEAVDLRVEESVLTGESTDVSKTSKPSRAAALEPFPLNMVYSSTSCVAGKGVCIVTQTGMQTQVGIIAQNLDVGAGGLSPLQETMNRVGSTLGSAVIVVIIVIALLCFLVRYQDPETPCYDTACFMWVAIAQGVSLGLAIVPTTLPMMTTLLLYVARKQISKKQAIVRKTSTIETLGCCMAICSDKTGTLTEGKMTAVKAVLPRTEKVHRFAFYPTAGADPYGAIFKDELLGEGEKHAIEKALEAGGRKFPLKNYGEKQQDLDDRHVFTLLVAASLNSTGTRLEKQSEKWTTFGNLSEGALVVAAAKAGIGPPVPGLNLQNAENLHPPETEVEVPFSSERKLMCTVHRTANAAFAGLSVGQDVTHVAVVKGAPDKLMPKASWSINQAGESLRCEPGFSNEFRERMLKENNLLADAALRVLLLCLRTLTADDFQQLRSFGTDADARADFLTQQLAVVGAFGIYDPPRATVGPSVAKCKSAGIRVVMITGDQLPTAAAIGLKLGLLREESEARLCADLYDPSGALRDEEIIDSMTSVTNVWARAQPLDKVSVVSSLQRMGMTTAMTGDGVNDAPALKNADIGTAMGITGTEVTIASADIVLMDDNFTTIVEAIQEGRRTYANVQQYVTFYLSLSLPEVASYAVCMMMGVTMPINAMQVIIGALLANSVPPLFYSKNPVSADCMKIPPRQQERPLLSRLTMLYLVVPWTIIWCTMWTALHLTGLWMHVGFYRTSQIVGSDTFKGVERGAMACEYASLKTGKETVLIPFHCQCSVRFFPFSEPEVLHQWGLPIVKEASNCGDGNEICISEERGKRGWKNLDMLVGRYKTPKYVEPFGVDEILQVCPTQGNDQSQRWCWRNEHLSSKEKRLLDKETNCGVLGSNAAHSMSFLGTVLAKLLLALAMSSEAPLIQTFYKNPPLLMSVHICLALSSLIVYLPVVVPAFRLPGTQPLPLGPLLTAVFFAVVAHVILDIIKIFYRQELSKVVSLRKFHAEMIRQGHLTAKASDEEVAECLRGHGCSFAQLSA